ncbi:MAG: hypothetical protein ACPGJU_09780 [Coraliomargarita sp.]
MKKTVTIGLITLGLGGAAHAADQDFTGDYNNNWVDTSADGSTGDSNWHLNKTTTDSYVLPTANDKVRILSGVSAVINSGDAATSAALTIQSNSSLTVDGTLDAKNILMGNSATLTNSGTLDIRDLSMNSAGAVVHNSGSITGSDGGASTGGLFIRNNGVFNNTGTYTAPGALAVSGGTAEYGGTLNLSGGTMTFTGIDWFDTGTDQYGKYTIAMSGTSQLVIEGQNLVSYFQQAITDGHLTGVTADQVTFDGLDTFVAIPEPGSYALLAGCFGLTWVMLRRRR